MKAILIQLGAYHDPQYSDHRKVVKMDNCLIELTNRGYEMLNVHAKNWKEKKNHTDIFWALRVKGQQKH